MYVEDVPKIVCKKHCPKGYVLENGCIWCDHAGSQYSQCFLSDEKINELIRYETINN